MKIYLVGGAVRDELLNRPVEERDWVVVGSTPEQLLQKGFKPVGNHFPVFLHPTTQEEYALARTERKIAKGYKGFEFYSSPDVTLEEDLKRRDLTINAIAKTENDGLLDLFHGQDDLKNKILRHVSPAFAEDPVRILRVARFASRFDDFSVAPETMLLMKQMVKKGEVDALVPERVWQELYRSLKEPSPFRFFEVLDECSALKVIFPEILPFYKKRIEKLTHLSPLTADPVIRFAVFLNHNEPHSFPEKKHDLEEKIKQIKSLCKRLNIPKEYESLTLLLARFSNQCRHLFSLSEEEILILLQSLDAFRRTDRFEKFLLACEIDSSEEENVTSDDFLSSFSLLKKIHKAILALNMQEIIKNTSKECIPQEIFTARIDVVKTVLSSV